MSRKHHDSDRSQRRSSQRGPVPPRRFSGKSLAFVAGFAILVAGIVLAVVNSKSPAPVESATSAPVSKPQSGSTEAKWYSEIPGIDFTKMTAQQREDVLKRLNNESCGCGCKMTLAQCRHEDRSCPVSPGLVVKIVKEMTGLDFPVAKSAQPSISISTGPKEGDAAPDFTLQDLKGKPLKLSALRGKVVVLNFWATWCGPCRLEIPDFLKVYRQRKGQGLEIIGVSIDHAGVEVVKSYVERSGIDYPVAMSTREVTQGYGSPRSIPTTFVIDRQGKLRSTHVGAMSAAALEAALKPVL